MKHIGFCIKKVCEDLAIFFNRIFLKLGYIKE
jgi:hypothetical protein